MQHFSQFFAQRLRSTHWLALCALVLLLSPLTGQAQLSTPTITALSATSTTAGGPAVPLTVTGTNFVPGSVVFFGATPLATTVVSATQLTAIIPATLIALPSAINPVTVVTPAGISNPVNLAVNAAVCLAVSTPVVSVVNSTTLNVAIPAGGTTGPYTVVATPLQGAAVTVSAAAAGTVAVPGLLPNTTYLVTVNGTCSPAAGGGTSPPSTGVSVTTPAAAPTLTAISPNPVPAGQTTTVTLTGTGFAVGATTVNFNGASLAGTVTSSTTLTVALAAPASATAATYPVSVTTAGGTSNAVTLNVTPSAVAAPTLTSIAPNPVPAGQTTTVTLTGTGFVAGATTVNFNGTTIAGTVAAGSSTSLNVNLPVPASSTATSFLVSVTTANGTSNAVTLNVTPTAAVVPTLTSINPNSIPAGQTTTVTFAGTGFVAGATVNFNGASLPATFINATTLTASIPAPASGVTATFSVSVTTPGGTTGTQTLTVTPAATTAPTLASVNPNPVTAGQTTTVTLTGTGFIAGGTTVNFNGTTLAGTVAAGSTTSLTVTLPVPAAAASYPITVTTANGTSGAVTLNATTATAGLGDLVVSTPQTISGAYNNVTVTATGVATVGATLTVNGTLLIQPSGQLISNCQPIVGPGNFVLETGATLFICDMAGISAAGSGTGSVQLSGTRTYSNDANYVYNGTVPQITGTGLPGRVRSLEVNNSNNNVSLTNGLSVAQVLRLTNGSLNTAARPLTLLSSSAGTALVVNTGGIVNGTGTMQRYIDPSLNGGRGYRHYSAPVSNTTLDDLRTTTYSPIYNPAYNTVGNTVTPFPDVYFYNEGRVTSPANTVAAFDQGFQTPQDATMPMETGRGYAVNISGTELVDFTGLFNNGPVVKGGLTRSSQPQSGWQLLGNPYPSPIDWNLLPAASFQNVDRAVYVYRSSGQYTGSYLSYVNGVGAAPQLIAAGQGFFVRVSTPGTGSLSLDNGNRTTTFSSVPTFNRGTADARPQVQLRLRGTGPVSDDAYVYFQQGATAGFDGTHDAYKLPSTTGVSLASLANSTGLSINGLPALTARTAVPLALNLATAGACTLRAEQLLNFGSGTAVTLHDALLNTDTNLATQPSYAFTATQAGDQGARFTLFFAPATALAAHAGLTAAQVDVFPNPSHLSFTLRLPATPAANAVTATLLNALGQVVQQRAMPGSATGADAVFNVQGLPAGVYMLRLTTSGMAPVVKHVVVN